MIVVAGASGRTGKRVASGLLTAGRKVRVLLHSASEREAWLAGGAEVEVLSLEDAPALARAVRGADGLYALVPEDLRAREFRGARRRIVHALSSLAVPHVVLLSASAAALPDGNGPAAELHLAERALRARKLTVIRASYFQENLLASMHAGVLPNFFADADQPLPMVATRDVAELALRCLLEPAHEIIDLLGPRCSMRQAAQVIGSSLQDVARTDQARMLMRAGVPDELAHSLPELYACLPGLLPSGDRLVAGSTTLEETVRGMS